MSAIVTEKVLKNKKFFPNLRAFGSLILFQIVITTIYCFWKLRGNESAAVLFTLMVGISIYSVIWYIKKDPIKLIFTADRIYAQYMFVNKELATHEVEGLQLKGYRKRPAAGLLLNPHRMSPPYLALDLQFGEQAFQILPGHFENVSNKDTAANRKILMDVVTELQTHHLLPDVEVRIAD